MVANTRSSGNFSANTGGDYLRCTANGEGFVNAVITGAGLGQFRGGVRFGTDSADANTLHDYEEGTWTPGIDRNALSMSGVTYSYTTGTYTKIGRLVMVWFDLNVTAGGTSGMGVPYIAGLPFTALSGSGGASNGGYGAPTFRAVTLLQSGFRIYGSSSYVQNTQIFLYNYDSSGAQVVSSLNSTGRLTGQAFYFTTA